jgi:hypothetical protein
MSSKPVGNHMNGADGLRREGGVGGHSKPETLEERQTQFFVLHSAALSSLPDSS